MTKLVDRLRSFALLLWHALFRFRDNHGLLLSGAVAFYGLLSIVPLTTLILVVLSQFANEDVVLRATAEYLEVVLPLQADALLEQVKSFLDNRRLIGWLGGGMLLFFASAGFGVMEDAMKVVFRQRFVDIRRALWKSALIRLAMVLLVGLGILAATLLNGLLQGLNASELTVFGIDLSEHGSWSVYLTSLAGLILLMTTFYRLMPVGHIRFKHALIGGATAALLWDGTRHLMVWYLTNLSVVNVIYGSMATAVIILLGFEVMAIIILFGAQVIAMAEEETHAQPTDPAT